MSLKFGTTNYVRAPCLDPAAPRAKAFALFENRLVNTTDSNPHRAMLFAGVSNTSYTSRKGVDGALVSGVSNYAEGQSKGLVVGTVNFIGCNHDGGFSGLMAGAVNKVGGVCSTAKGAIAGAVNHMSGGLEGIVLSLAYNFVAMKAKGAMVSAVNECEKLIGVQVGVLNIIKQGSRGVQVGLLNIREYAPWYAKVVPGVAVRWSDKRAPLAEPKVNHDY